MDELCSRCGEAIQPEIARGSLCDACRSLADEQSSAPMKSLPEYDHRGVRMPARTRVGGIIIPQ
ncbi:hypothetical protein ACPOL_1175 [Acidisarcina polymorpha]|uniref:Uncharacterized protein n=1 Tax=Acidisarcina polymorpha TaxID=2211140 RepID=A0A2Z5FUH7_9BACT|nr:hypothetical protein ACPOL_1175 [Acidisarcina polymorpha]